MEELENTYYLLLAVKDGEGEDEIVLGCTAVSATVLYQRDEVIELECLFASGELTDTTGLLWVGLAIQRFLLNRAW